MGKHLTVHQSIFVFSSLVNNEWVLHRDKCVSSDFNSTEDFADGISYFITSVSRILLYLDSIDWNFFEDDNLMHNLFLTHEREFHYADINF